MMKPSPKHQLRSPTPTGEHSTHIPGPPLPTPRPQQGQPQGSAGLLLTGVSTRSPGEGGPGGPAQWVTIPTLPPTYHTPDWLLFLVFYSLHMLKAPPGEGTVTMTRAWGGGQCEDGEHSMPGEPCFPVVGCSLQRDLSSPQCPTSWEGTGASLAQGIPVPPFPQQPASLPQTGKWRLAQGKGHFHATPSHKGHLHSREHRTQQCPPHIGPPASPRVLSRGWARDREGPSPPQPHSQRMGQPQHGRGQDGTVLMCESRVPATSQGSWDPRTAQGPDSFFRFWKRRNLSWMASAAFSVSGALRSMSISSSSTFLGSPALAEGGDRTGAALVTAWHPQTHPSAQ